MIYVTNSQLREHVDMESLNTELIMEIFLALRDGKQNFIFTNMDDYQNICPQHALNCGWNPETTLVLFAHVDSKQIICSFFPNLTFERMVKVFTSYSNLKAFL